MRRLKRLRTSNVTKEDLLAIEASKKRRADRPKALALNEIHLADKVFQWRNLNENIAASVDHLKELERVLRSTKEPLDPVTVTPIGDKFFLLEGHHRLEAYRAVGWRKPIPVKYYLGSVEEAVDEALVLNVKDKLRMSRSEKFDAAFRLLKQRKKTYEQIKGATTVSIRTINNMATVLREYPEAAKEASWRRARWLHQQTLEAIADVEDRDIDWKEKKARKLAKQLIHNVGTGFVRDADITARALEIVDENLPRALVYEWLDIAEDVLVEVAREQSNEWAEELLRAFIYGQGADASPIDAGVNEEPEL